MGDSCQIAADLLRLSSGPLNENGSGNDDEEDDGPPALQMSNEELVALQSRFRLECDVNSDSDDSSDDGPLASIKVTQDVPGSMKLKTSEFQKDKNTTKDESACFPTDSMILENKTIYENMLQEDPNNQTTVEKWQSVNRPKYISRPDGWDVARSNDLVQMTPEEYLSLRSEPIRPLGLMPRSASPKSSVSTVNGPRRISPEMPEKLAPPKLKVSEPESNDVSVNIDYLLQPNNPSSEILDQTAVSNASAIFQVYSEKSEADKNKAAIPIVVQAPDSGRDTDRLSPVSETSSSHSNNASVSFSFNNASAIGDATDPDLAAVDQMLEMYDTDVDPEQLAEHIMMRFGVNPQRPSSSSGIFRDQDESLLRPTRGTGLSIASVVSSTPKVQQPAKNSSRPGSAQSSTSRRKELSNTSHITLENVSGGRTSADTLTRAASALTNNTSEKRISVQSVSSPSNPNGDVFLKPAKPTGIENKVSPKRLSANSDVSLLSSLDGSSISEYGPILTPIAEKGPFIRLEWDKLAIDLKQPVFVGQSHDIALTANNTGRLWVQLNATLQNTKIDGKLTAGPKDLHILNSTVVIEPNASGNFRLRFTPGEAGFFSANVDLFACVVGSVIEESRSLPPIPFSADVRLPSVEFQIPGQNICDFGALPAGSSRRMTCSLRLQPPQSMTPASPSYDMDVPVVVTIRPESAWRCFHLLPNGSDSASKSKAAVTAPAPLYGSGHATKLYLSPIHKQHDFTVSFNARYDTEMSPNQQGLDINDAELVAQTDSTPPLKLASISLQAGVGIVSVKAVGLDESTDESTTLRMSCQLSSNGQPNPVNRSFFLVNSGTIGVDITTSLTSPGQDGSNNLSLFSIQPSQFTLLPKQKMQLSVKFVPNGLSLGEMCAGFLSFFTDPPQSGIPGQLPALDVSLIGVVPTRPVETTPSHVRTLPTASSANSTPMDGHISMSSNSGSETGSSTSSAGSRRSLVTSHQRVVWWGLDSGQSVEQVVNLRNVGSDEVNVRISIRSSESDFGSASFTLAGSTSASAPLLATLPANSDFPMRIIFQAQSRHQFKAAIAKLQIKVLASGAGSVPPGLKFCIPLFGAVGTAAMTAEGSTLRTTSAGHYYAIIGSVPFGAKRHCRLTLRNCGSRSAFFSALPFADMSCTQRVEASKVICTPSTAVVPAGDCLEIAVELTIGEREAALCAERSYIISCLQIVFGDNDLRSMAARAASSMKTSEVKRVLDDSAIELIRTKTESLSSSISPSPSDAWPEHVKIFSRHYKRLYVALVGEKTSAASSNGGVDFNEETLQHTMLLDDTQATIMMPPPSMLRNERNESNSISSLVESRSSVSRQPIAVAPSLTTVIDSPHDKMSGVRLLPAELLLTALSDSRTLMLINDTSSSTDFEADWPSHILSVEPASGKLQSNGTATIHVRLAPGAASFVDSSQQSWAGKVTLQTGFGNRLESSVRIHLNGVNSTAQARTRQMQASRADPVTQVVFGARDCPYPPAARLDFGQMVMSLESVQRKLSLRLENEQPFPINWQLEELSAYALATSGPQHAANGSNRCIPSIFTFSPIKSGSLSPNGGQVLLKCLFQAPPNSKQTQDVSYLQHFLLTVKGSTGWSAETRISCVASMVVSSTSSSTVNSSTNVSMNMADQSHLSRVSNSSTMSAAPLSANRRPPNTRQSLTKFLICPGERHEFRKIVRPGESAKEKVNLENRSSSQPLYVEIASGPSLPFATKHRRFTIEPMHYLHLPVIFKPVAPGSFHSEMTLHATTTSPPNNGIPDEVLTVTLLAQASL